MLTGRSRETGRRCNIDLAAGARPIAGPFDRTPASRTIVWNHPVSVMIHRRSIILVLPFVLSVAAVSPASDEADESKRCINSRVIKSTDVVNDRNIIFYMRGSKIFLNTLPKPCKGLSRERRFTYVSHSRSLCRLDRISVLKDSGFGAYAGRSCKLGRFLPVTKEDIAFKFAQQRNMPEAPVEAPPIEELDNK